jgi:hypothetical protein
MHKELIVIPNLQRDIFLHLEGLSSLTLKGSSYMQGFASF